MVPPPPALMVAAEPTCQNTFFAWAPLVRITLLGKAAPGPPTVSEVADAAGREVVDRIAAVPTGQMDRPQTDVVVNKVTIERVTS